MRTSVRIIPAWILLHEHGGLSGSKWKPGPELIEQPLTLPVVTVVSAPLVLTALLFGDYRKFRQLGGCDADALEALGHNAVGSGKQADQQIDRRYPAVVIDRPQERFAQQADHIIG